MTGLWYMKMSPGTFAGLCGTGTERVLGWINRDGLPVDREGCIFLFRGLRWLWQRADLAERERIEHCEVKQHQLGKLLGVSRQTLLVWESKHGLPRQKNGRYDLAQVCPWLPQHYNNIYRRKYRSSVKELRKTFQKILKGLENEI